MACFDNFTVPPCRILGGNLLLFATLLFYIAWWTVTFRPGRAGGTASAKFYIGLALLTGLAAITIMFSGIEMLAQGRKASTVINILLGAAALYIFLLLVTRFAFQRPVTAELLLIIFWASLEFSAISVLQGSGYLSMELALALAGLMVLAAVIGLVCYIMHYRLDEVPRFWNGLIPLIVDAGVVAVFLMMLAFS
jgi:hypothetical protein